MRYRVFAIVCGLAVAVASACAGESAEGSGGVPETDPTTTTVPGDQLAMTSNGCDPACQRQRADERARAAAAQAARLAASQPTTTLFEDPRGAAANVGFVERLVTTGEVPHAASVTSVTAEGDVIVISTTLIGEAKATEVWEAVAKYLGCDDSFLRVGGWHVVLADGSKVSEPSAGYEPCAGT